MHITPRHSNAAIPHSGRTLALRRGSLFLCIMLLLAACGPSDAGGLTITGSTSVTPFAEHLAELYQKQHPGTAINIQGLGSSAGIRAALDNPRAPPPPRDLNLDRSERDLIRLALERHRFNISQAAKELGLTRAALYRRMEKHGL